MNKKANDDCITKFTPVFLGSGRCFHTLDWFRSCELISSPRPIFITDNFGGEGFIPLLNSSDLVRRLIIIDPFLFKNASKLGHLWRNAVKLLLLPFQVLALRSAMKSISNPFVFSHSTYYSFIASFCNVKYSATPQGSEVLVRPHRSKLYRMILIRSLKYASFITVDSDAMKLEIIKLANISSNIIQNGINVSEILKLQLSTSRTLITSIRGVDGNYRINEILESRNRYCVDCSINFCFPFSEDGYHKKFLRLLDKKDTIHGRLNRQKMYELLGKSYCVISIPLSDSSPRSVYEAIFSGAIVACTFSPYINSLPKCMIERIVLVDLSDENWFMRMIDSSKYLAQTPYTPSVEALDMFDQRSSMKKVLSLAYSASKFP